MHILLVDIDPALGVGLESIVRRRGHSVVLNVDALDPDSGVPAAAIGSASGVIDSGAAVDQLSDGIELALRGSAVLKNDTHENCRPYIGKCDVNSDWHKHAQRSWPATGEANLSIGSGDQ